MRILLIGSGGREHALAWKIKDSLQCEALYCAPSNAGIAEIAQTVKVDVTNHNAVINFCHTMQIDFVVVGNEAPLVAGLVDDLAAAGVLAFGPSKYASQLEGSKSFTKAVCDEANIPTAVYKKCTSKQEALDYVNQQGAPIVLKADGLAAGKGVVVAMTLEEAIQGLDFIFSDAIGEAGAAVVIEEFLEGEEASFFVLCDGTRALPFGSAQDHKRVFDGDLGANTGGMGAYSPAPCFTKEIEAEVMASMIEPTLKVMRERGHPYKGILYAGVIIKDGKAKLIEYNCRLGDPECQTLMMRLQEDIMPLLLNSAKGNLRKTPVNFAPATALTVVMAAEGYPQAPVKGAVISALPQNDDERHFVFHAGTKREDGVLKVNGGRVLNVTAMGVTAKQAQENAYKLVKAIFFDGGFYRTDIGKRAIDLC